jgi:hypothetical protein
MKRALAERRKEWKKGMEIRQKEEKGKLGRKDD